MNEQEHDIPEIVIIRLPLYVRTLNELKLLNQTTVSSQHLGNLLQTTPAQIRKDFSHFGKFGKQGRGYNIDYLLDELRKILNLNQKWNTCVIGIGNLGQAVINYQGFKNEGYLIKAAFDISLPSRLDNKDIVIKTISDMKNTIKELNIKILENELDKKINPKYLISFIVFFILNFPLINLYPANPYFFLI